MTPWKIMREVSKPVRGFEYECPSEHTWFVPITEWEGRGENGCKECENIISAPPLEA